MSSLAAASADGFYHPPDYDPRRHGGLSKFQGSTGANQYQKYGIIRFELPYNSWCLGCDKAIGQGTRYNAKKVSAGKYFSTTIWEFRMKCAMCDHPFVIRTDPKNSDYAFVEGIKRIESMPTPASAETIELNDDATKLRLETDALFAFENKELDKKKAAAQAEHLINLMELNDKTSRDNYAINRVLRRKARGDRKAVKQLAKDGEQAGLPFALAPEDTATRKAAKHLVEARVRKKRRRPVDSRDLGVGLMSKNDSEKDVEVVVRVKRKKKKKKKGKKR